MPGNRLPAAASRESCRTQRYHGWRWIAAEASWPAPQGWRARPRRTCLRQTISRPPSAHTGIDHRTISGRDAWMVFEAMNATYCLPLARYVMGLALMLRGTLVLNSSRPLRASRAKNSPGIASLEHQIASRHEISRAADVRVGRMLVLPDELTRDGIVGRDGFRCGNAVFMVALGDRGGVAIALALPQRVSNHLHRE